MCTIDKDHVFKVEVSNQVVPVPGISPGTSPINIASVQYVTLPQQPNTVLLAPVGTTSTQVSAMMRMCVCVLPTCTYTCICTGVYVCMYVHYVCVYMHTYIHTHVHNVIFSLSHQRGIN